jgi:hypothetical protein
LLATSGSSAEVLAERAGARTALAPELGVGGSF